MLSFLFLNGFVMLASDDELEEFAVGVADDSISRGMSTQFVDARLFRVSWSVSHRARRARRLSGDDLQVIRSLLKDTIEGGPGGRVSDKVWLSLLGGSPPEVTG